jgi:hypothetical protein
MFGDENRSAHNIEEEIMITGYYIRRIFEGLEQGDGSSRSNV